MAGNTTPKQPNRFRTVTKYLKGYRTYLILGGIAVLFANGLLLVNPYLTKIIFDKLENAAPMNEVGLLALAMVGLAAVGGAFRFAMRRTIIWMSRKIEYDLRSELAEHLFKLSASFYDRNRTGDIMARMTNDLEAVRQMVGPAIMQLTNTFVVATGALTMMIILSPKLTAYSLIPAIVLPVIMHRLGNLIHKKFARIQEHFSHLTAVTQENLAGVRVVKAYQQEEAETKNFDGLSQKYLRLNLDLGKLQAMFLPLIQLVATGLVLVLLYFGGREVIIGNVELSTIVAFLLYLGMLVWPLMAIGWVVSLYQRGTASLDRINNILNTEPGIQNVGDNLRTERIRGKVELRNLTFAYDSGESDAKPVLKDISLTLQPGETLGVVGMTGSGKTTLVSLLARLYPVERGQLFIDDVDINDWGLAELRRQVGFAPQEPFLFSSTVAENIAFGATDSDRAAIEETAVTAALAKDIDTFPAGYETTVGERGITLSGGQKQRTAIARAIMVDPSILVLDDATASVDMETEYEINQRIHARTRALTTFIVSHRVASVKDADQIIYLQDGTVIEHGTHDELIAQKGHYADLYQSQLLAEEIDKL
ncbi:ATP-binding cassette domain-containing protein [candidate division GN15 bacterium]|nr:ATP-binding cassette domain-containing protein [candidate division GN15 bacterium]